MRFTILAFVFCLFFAACSEKKVQNPQEDARKELLALEKQLMNDPATQTGNDRLNDSLASKVVKAYLKFAETYPNDSLSPDYLFKAADVMRGQFRWENALEVLNLLVEKYPNDQRVPNALFFAGFMLHNDLGENNKATPYLERVTNEFPNHPLAKDAAMLLQTMHMSEDELIKMLEEKQQPQS